MLRSHRRRYLVPVVLSLVWGCAHAGQDEPGAEPAGIVAAPGPCIDVTPDGDADGLADACELALSNAFAPLLMMHSTRCTLPSAQAAQRVPGGYFHAAQPVQGTVRLVYMPAYYRDCGWDGAKCILVNCRGHAGDSELIVVDVRQNQNGAWVTEAIFLSAHCFGRDERDCRWYRGDELDEFEWVDDIDHGAPIVWVSDARNANYPTYGACERGHFRIDSCERESAPYRFPVTPERNIGSRVEPLVQPGQQPGCVNGAFIEPADRLVVSPDAVECFWSESTPFRGWQDSGAGATAYGRYLDNLGL